MSVSLEVSQGHDPNDRQRGTTHQPGPSNSHESRHESDSSTTTLPARAVRPVRPAGPARPLVRMLHHGDLAMVALSG